jgi:hypothetical protein
MSMANYPDCKHADSLEVGHQFQDFVCCELAKQGIILQNLASRKYQFNIGENIQGFEIKFDGRCTDTGRLSIEIAEKSRADMPEWTQSGIYRSDNTWLYIQGNYQLLYIFAVNVLRNMHGSGKFEEHEEPKYTPTVRAFFLPFSYADKWCAKKIIL